MLCFAKLLLVSHTQLQLLQAGCIDAWRLANGSAGQKALFLSGLWDVLEKLLRICIRQIVCWRGPRKMRRVPHQQTYHGSSTGKPPVEDTHAQLV